MCCFAQGTGVSVCGLSRRVEHPTTPPRAWDPRVYDLVCACIPTCRSDNGEGGAVDFIFCDVGQRERYPEVHELAMQLLHVSCTVQFIVSVTGWSDDRSRIVIHARQVGGVIVYYDTLWAADDVRPAVTRSYPSPCPPLPDPSRPARHMPM